MKGKLLAVAAVLLLSLAVCFLGGTAAPPNAGLAAAFAEGAPKAHPAVELLDYAGKPVDPDSQNPKPYSPRQTCGACHDYETISKGYHFQMGAEKISDDFGKKIGKPWILSDGMSGKQIHMSYASLSRKRNSSEAEVGLTAYEFARTCGACHAGGGLMEHDRDGKRYDARLAKSPDLARSFDGDYHESAWDASGVVEIDCLMCHQAGYDGKTRTDQISKANFKWAATAGAGLAAVEGSVKDGQSPRLAYDKSRFNADGTVSLKIGEPPDANCLLCHDEAQTKKRGHTYDGRNTDVHTGAGLTCVTCHTAGEDHQIRKAKSNAATVRNDLDDPTFSCEGCHLDGKVSKKPAHKSIPSSHLKSIACATCHVRESNVAAVHTVDTTTGKAVGIPTVKGAKKYGESGAWTPAYFRLEDGRIHSGNALLPAWWGNRVGSMIYPLYLPETARAYEKVKDRIKDDDGDGRPEANTQAEITAMLGAVKDVLAGGRFKEIWPAYVKGNRVWQVSGGRLIAISHHPQAKPLNWAFSHNVSPAKKAWGATGCGDCHGDGSAFFNSPVVVDPFDGSGKQVSVPMWRYVGVDESVIGAKP